MMDGQVAAIRSALDDAGFREVAICAYAVKYASAFYGPFRDAAECAPQFGDRAAYQQDHGSQAEALREVLLDVDEGADIVMIKPALAYLDIISLVAGSVPVPVAAYQVSGEYAMIEAAAANGADLRLVESHPTKDARRGRYPRTVHRTVTQTGLPPSNHAVSSG